MSQLFGNIVQYIEVVAPLFVTAAAPAPDLSWHPSYPDQIDRRQFLSDQQQFSAANIQPEQTIARAWAPSYPDQIDRLLVHPSRIPSEFEPPFSVRDLGHIGWEPEFPDRVWPLDSLKVASQQFFAINHQPETTVHGWNPTYPDWIDRKTMSANLQQSLALELAARALGHMGWEPEYPDFARAATSVVWQQFLAAPSPQPELTIALAWKPVYPDQIDRIVLPTAAQLAFVINHQPELTIPLAWQPVYPDKIWDLKLPPAALSFLSLDVFPRPDVTLVAPIYPDRLFTIPTQLLGGETAPPSSVRDLGHTGWYPTYPDQHWTIGLLTALQRDLFLDPFPRVEFGMGWLSTYPDWLVKLFAQPASGEFAPPSSPRDLGHIGWEPEYPDQIARLFLLTAQQQAWAANIQPELTVPLAWQPTYQDWIARATLSVSSQQSHGLDPFPRPNVNDVAWIAQYPDFIPRLSPLLMQWLALELGPVQPLGHIGWEPEYPDQIWRVVLPTAAQQWLAFDPFPRPQAAAPDLSWGPSYPEQIFRITLPVAAYPFHWWNPETISAPPSPDLAWKPVYPDQIWRHYLLTAQQLVTARRLDAPAETVLSSWEPSYPNFIHRRVLPTAMREGNSIAAAIEQAVAPLKWEPRMPTRLDPKRLPIALYPSFFEAVPGELIAIGQRMAWKFYEPQWLRRYPPVVPEAVFWTIPPFVPAGAIDCVELIDDSFTVPALINQIFTAPVLLDEGLTVPKLIEQDLC